MKQIFSIIIVVFALCTAQTLSAQSLRNGSMDEPCDTCATKLRGWTPSWANAGVSCGAFVDGGERSLLIDCAKEGVGFVEQSITVAPTKGAVIFTLSGRVRVEELSGKGASLNVACYDANDAFLTNKDQGLFWYNWVQGTKPWVQRALKLILPEGTRTVKVGAIVKGKGKAWFDDLVITISPLEGRLPDEAALAYVAAAMDTIRQHALYRDSVGLQSLHITALQIAGGNNDAGDRHLAVEYLLQSLGDHHSFLMRPDEYKGWQSEGGEAAFTHATHKVIDGYGYMLVPAFMSGDSLSMLAFADSLQRGIAALQKQGVRGWIVDLRQNTGGNMGPMICGLGPLLQPGVLGTLTDVNGAVERWYYRGGEYGWDDQAAMLVPNPVVLRSPPPIAVLTSSQTGSSGECTTISFVGNPRTRSFGQPTWGLTTGNGQFALSDGAQMFLASTSMGDRNGKLFHGAIVPDEVVEEPADKKFDATLDAALRWLKGQ